MSGRAQVPLRPVQVISAAGFPKHALPRDLMISGFLFIPAGMLGPGCWGHSGHGALGQNGFFVGSIPRWHNPRSSPSSPLRAPRIHLKGLTGSAGKISSISQPGSDFSTKDVDQDRCICKCAQMLTGGRPFLLVWAKALHRRER